MPRLGTQDIHHQAWETPPTLFNKLNKEFNFTVDAAANHDNHLLPRYWTSEVDGLSQPWDNEVVFCNPPFRQAGQWALRAAYSQGISVLVLPAALDTRWWDQAVVERASEVRFIPGRVQFYRGGVIPDTGAALTSAVAVVIWRPNLTGPPTVIWRYSYPGRGSGWFQQL